MASPSNQWLSFCSPSWNLDGPFLRRVPDNQLGISPRTSNLSITTSSSRSVNPRSPFFWYPVSYRLTLAYTHSKTPF
ncbi:MAG: hypothetical protein WCF07_02765 [Nitrososphaeraceae archaeon]